MMSDDNEPTLTQKEIQDLIKERGGSRKPISFEVEDGPGKGCIPLDTKAQQAKPIMERGRYLNPDDEPIIDATDMVNEPPHYKGKGGLELNDVIQAFDLQHHHYLAAALKYILRCYTKDTPIRNVGKLMWYAKQAQLEILQENLDE